LASQYYIRYFLSSGFFLFGAKDGILGHTDNTYLIG